MEADRPHLWLGNALEERPRGPPRQGSKCDSNGRRCYLGNEFRARR
jgi:hypothetical protein